MSEAAWLMGPADGAGLVVRVLVTPAAVMRCTPGQAGQSLLSSNAEWLTNQVVHRPPLRTFCVYISSSVDRCRSHSRLLRWTQGREIRVAARQLNSSDAANQGPERLTRRLHPGLVLFRMVCYKVTRT